jgi:hypothetical protein
LWIVLITRPLVQNAALDTIARMSRQHAIETANRQTAATVLLLRERMARILPPDERALDLVDQAVPAMAWQETGHAVNGDRRLPPGGLPKRLNVADRDCLTTLRADRQETSPCP